MKPLILFFGLLISIGCFAQSSSRELKTVSFTGQGYELGLQHGKALKNEIADILDAWKQNTSINLGKDADKVLNEFFEYANFDEAIKTWTPELFEEVRGIAEGSGQKFNDIMALNLLDEFWVYVDDLNNHHCSGLGVPSRNGSPAFISQNMDLENYTDGFQVLMRLNRTGNNPEQLVLTHPGLIALNGLNEEGIGACMNTLMQLKASANGLPVAFIVRGILNTTNKDEALKFIQTVPHASGQNYIIGVKGEVFDFEASANKVVRYNPMNENGTVYHTNHPLVNDDMKPWFEQYNPSSMKGPKSSNSHLRLRAVENRMKSSSEVNEALIKETLRSKDDNYNPVCRANNEDGRGFTFASTIMTLTGKPNIQVLAGPPDEADYVQVDFTEKPQ